MGRHYERKEGKTAWFREPFWDLPVGSEESYDKLQLGK
jgi:hypothetical protein